VSTDALELRVRSIAPRSRVSTDALELRVKIDPELRVAAAEVLALPEETLLKLLKVKRVLPTSEERKLTTITRTTTSLENREKSIPSTEEMALAEAEALPRVALVRQAGAQLRMKSSKALPLK
jgi:hypothetical protein